MESKSRAGNIEKIAVNVLSGLGAFMYIALQCNPYSFLPAPEQIIKSFAFSLLMLVQIGRALITVLKPSLLPQWLQLKKMDRRFAADSTITFLLLILVLELTVRGQITAETKTLVPTIAWWCFGLQVVLGSWLLVIVTKKAHTNLVLGLVALLLFTVVFLSPFLAAGVVAFALYKAFDMHTEREYAALGAAALVPLMVATAILMARDKRDRAKNTGGVILNQILALPAIPVVYLLIDHFWPQNTSPAVFPLIWMVIIVLPAFFARRLKPWLVRERVELLTGKIVMDPELRKTPSPEMEAEMRAIAGDLEEKRLVLKNASDHIDRGDALWKFGDLQVDLCRYDLAEASYNQAVHAYNRALELEPENRTAIAHKFKTVEALSSAQEIKRRSST